MSDGRAEIGARARMLVAARGRDILDFNGKVTSRSVRIGVFYMRVLANGELYVNDMAPSPKLGCTVFSQREHDSTGSFHYTYATVEQLLGLLRAATVLDELANV